MSNIDLLIKKRIRIKIELWRDIVKAEEVGKTETTRRAREHLANITSDIQDLKEKRKKEISLP